MNYKKERPHQFTILKAKFHYLYHTKIYNLYLLNRIINFGIYDINTKDQLFILEMLI